MRARLINPELVRIYPSDRASQREDALAGEPYARLGRGGAISIKAQVDDGRRNDRAPGQGGALSHQAATLSFLARDVLAADWTPTAGDRVVEVADRDGRNPRTVNWYVSTVNTSGKEYARAKLVVVTVSDRDAARAQTEGL